MQLESSKIEISTLLVEFAAFNELSRVGKPLLEMPFCFGACLVWLKRFWRRKGITLQFAKDDSVAGDIDEEGAALRELRVHLHRCER